MSAQDENEGHDCSSEPEEETQRIAPIPEGEIKLIVGEGGGQVDSTTPIRWCLDRKAAAHLKSAGAATSWVLISVVDDEDDCEIERRLVPLEQMLDFIRFPRPGAYQLYATVLYCTNSEPEIKALIRNGILRRRSPQEYQRTLFQHLESRLFEPSWAVYNLGFDSDAMGVVGNYSASVTVSSEFFAKEPPRWLDKWARLIWQGPLRDQCDFRKRLVFSCTAQLPCLAIIAAFGVITSTVKAFWALTALSLGMRTCDRNGINWRPILTPFTGSPYDVWDGQFYPHWDEGDGGSFILWDRKGRKRPAWFTVLTPLAWVLAFAVLTSLVFWDTGDIAKALLMAARATAVLFLFVVGVSSLGYYAIRLLSADEEHQWKTEERRRKEAELSRKDLEQSMSLLLCDTAPVRAELAALPRAKQTIYLRFLDLKAKVCRQYTQ